VSEQMSTLFIYAFYEMTQQKNLFIEVFTVNYTFSEYKRWRWACVCVCFYFYLSFVLFHFL